jgi:hypothetical protein
MQTNRDPYRSPSVPAVERRPIREKARTVTTVDAAPKPTPKCDAYAGRTGAIRFTPITLSATIHGVFRHMRCAGRLEAIFLAETVRA